MTLVEYADLQCPYCAQWARDALPTLVEDYVKSGKLRIVFSGMAFIGPDSDKALRTALAAGREDHLWDVVHGLYRVRATRTPAGSPTSSSAELAAGVPDLDGEELLDTPLGALGHGGAGARRRGCTGRRRQQHTVVPDRTDRRDADARSGQLARARTGSSRRSRRCWPDERADARLASAALATLGAAITGYLLYVRENGGELVCSTGGCETVQNSPYAEVLGVPVAALGLAGFLGLFAAALGRGEWAGLARRRCAVRTSVQRYCSTSRSRSSTRSASGAWAPTS